MVTLSYEPGGYPVAKMMLEIPTELNAMLPALRDLVETVATQVECGRTGGTVDYAAFERRIAEKAAEVERRSHGVALSALALSAAKVSINKVLHTRVLKDEETTLGADPL